MSDLASIVWGRLGDNARILAMANDLIPPLWKCGTKEAQLSKLASMMDEHLSPLYKCATVETQIKALREKIAAAKKKTADKTAGWLGNTYAPGDNLITGSNPFKSNFWLYNQPSRKFKEQANKLDRQGDAVNAAHRAAGRDERWLGHQYSMNGKPLDVQFPDQGQLGEFKKYQYAQNPKLKGRNFQIKPNEQNTVLDFNLISRPAIMARQEAISHAHPNIPLPKIRTAKHPLNDESVKYFKIFGGGEALNLSPNSPLVVADHEHGHHLARYLSPNIATTLGNELIANEYGVGIQQLLPQSYRTPENQFKHVSARNLGTYINGADAESRQVLKEHASEQLKRPTGNMPSEYWQRVRNYADGLRANPTRHYPSEAFMDKR